MNPEQDSLELIAVDKWSEIQGAFKLDLPRGFTGYNALETQKRWINDGIDCGFKVYCPFGDLRSGMVAVLCDKEFYYEILIECPTDDTTKLEEALRKTKVINWKRDIVVLFPPEHVVQCVRNVVDDVNVVMGRTRPLTMYILDKECPFYEVIVPPGFTFKPLSKKHAEVVDSFWPHRYPGSVWYFNLLIQAKSGFGLFKDDELITWVFVKEIGALGNLYTLEEHRKKGYGEVITKLVCNILLKEGRSVNSYCLENNVGSCKLHEKLGFTGYSGPVSFELISKQKVLKNKD